MKQVLIIECFTEMRTLIKLFGMMSSDVTFRSLKLFVSFYFQRFIQWVCSVLTRCCVVTNTAL